MAKYRIGVIGHTGKGNYGHGMDRVWLDVPRTQIVAVADADAKGLASARKRAKVDKAYGDYRKMLAEQKPDIVAVCPRWLDQHRDMVVAAANTPSVKGIYMEKPMCRSLEEADEMIAACRKRQVKLAIAFQTRYSPKLNTIKQLIEDGAIGTVLEYRGRGKEDRRGGGEDLWVLGTHIFNLIHYFAGEPKWCFAQVRQNGKPITKKDVRNGPEGIGPLAGDSVQAMYRMADDRTAYFNTNKDQRGSPSRFGLQIFGSKGIIEMFTGHIAPAAILADSSWSPGRTKSRWKPISSAGIDKPEPIKDGGLHGGNILVVNDLIDAIEEDREPEASIYEAVTSTEMIVACFESQRTGGPVKMPLKNRKNPLEML